VHAPLATSTRPNGERWGSEVGSGPAARNLPHSRYPSTAACPQRIVTVPFRAPGKAAAAQSGDAAIKSVPWIARCTADERDLQTSPPPPDANRERLLSACKTKALPPKGRRPAARHHRPGRRTVRRLKGVYPPFGTDRSQFRLHRRAPCSTAISRVPLESHGRGSRSLRQSPAAQNHFDRPVWRPPQLPNDPRAHAGCDPVAAAETVHSIGASDSARDRRG
jgi:hypothetical protein